MLVSAQLSHRRGQGLDSLCSTRKPCRSKSEKLFCTCVFGQLEYADPVQYALLFADIVHLRLSSKYPTNTNSKNPTYIRNNPCHGTIRSSCFHNWLRYINPAYLFPPVITGCYPSQNPSSFVLARNF